MISYSRIYYYFPLISEKEALEHESKSFLSRIVKGKAGVVLASLIKNSDLTKEDIKVPVFNSLFVKNILSM